MKTTFQILAFGAAAAALTVVAADLIVTEQTAPTFYRDFTRLTKRPHRVAPLTATLCTIPTRAVVEREKQMTGLHYQASVHLYANPPVLRPVIPTAQVPPDESARWCRAPNTGAEAGRPCLPKRAWRIHL
jgi:hypothetical protein